MTYPDSERPDNPPPPSVPVLEPYGLPGETRADQSTAAHQPGADQGFQVGSSAYRPGAEQSFQPAVQLPTTSEFTPATPPDAEPEPPRKKKTGLVVATVLAVLFFATAGVFGVLYSNEVGQNDRLTGQLADKEKQLTDSGKQLKDAQDEASRAKDAVEVAENARKRAEDDGAAMVKCRDAARALREAVFANDDPKGEQAFLDVFANC
ncbi:hypothetical protein ACQPZF_31865 [Actinosynnema sp. CS-041913]|uniref:hypothetical protein n=1 Tax=Actinosynnema sp. CS-041913 TaxID=3239917 RepID=UPI003D8B1569